MLPSRFILSRADYGKQIQTKTQAGVQIGLQTGQTELDACPDHRVRGHIISKPNKWTPGPCHNSQGCASKKQNKGNKPKLTIKEKKDKKKEKAAKK